MKHLDVVGAVIEYGGRILCMQRGVGRNAETSLKFEFPGGKVEPGETCPQALMRELSEELSMRVSISEADYLTTVTHQYPGFEITMFCYRCRPESPEFTRKEHISHVWARPEELLQLDWAPADRPVAELVAKKFKTEGNIKPQEVSMLKVGDKAPEFALKDKDGKEVRLSDYAGRRVVLYFYPKDNTPGCTRQACAFAGAFDIFEENGVTVIGVSKDSAASHAKFAEKYALPFVLLSDPELSAIKAYGVWQEKKNYGKVSMGVVRTTFIIGPDGGIEKTMPKVKPDTNAEEIIEYLGLK